MGCAESGLQGIPARAGLHVRCLAGPRGPGDVGRPQAGRRGLRNGARLDGERATRQPVGHPSDLVRRPRGVGAGTGVPRPSVPALRPTRRIDGRGSGRSDGIRAGLVLLLPGLVGRMAHRLRRHPHRELRRHRRPRLMVAGAAFGWDRGVGRICLGSRAVTGLTGSRVEARGWGWRHAGRRQYAVRELDLVIEPGERVLLLGASGAGKSTLLLALAGLLDPANAGEAEGSLTVDGLDPRDARDRIGLVLQDPETQLVMARSGDDVAFGPENHAVPPKAIWPRVDAALAAVRFPYGRDRRTDWLSGGEQQRLALAGVLALSPRLLLLDEPTANLDPAGAGLVRE